MLSRTATTLLTVLHNKDIWYAIVGFINGNTSADVRKVEVKKRVAKVYNWHARKARKFLGRYFHGMMREAPPSSAAATQQGGFHYCHYRVWPSADLVPMLDNADLYLLYIKPCSLYSRQTYVACALPLHDTEVVMHYLKSINGGNLMINWV